MPDPFGGNPALGNPNSGHHMRGDISLGTPPGPLPPPTPSFHMPRQFDGRGDWDCPNCHLNVFARNDVCVQCGTPRPGGPRRRGGKGGKGEGPRGFCYHCGEPTHQAKDCPKMVEKLETQDLVLRQTQSSPTVWGIVLDPRMRLKKASIGFPASDSKEYNDKIGWTVVAVNGNTISSTTAAMERLGGTARPGETIKLTCRQPNPIEQQQQFNYQQRQQEKMLRRQREMLEQAARERGGGGMQDAGPQRPNGKPSTVSPASPLDPLLQVDPNMRGRLPPGLVNRQVPKEAPCHPIGMSKAEADAEKLLESLSTQGPKRPRGDGECSVHEVARLLQLVRNELRSVRKDMERVSQEGEQLRRRLVEYDQVINKHDEEQKAKSGTAASTQPGDEGLMRKLEKEKKKLEKYKEIDRQHQQREFDNKKNAILRGIEVCSDDEVVALAEAQSSITVDDAWSILGLTRGQDGVQNVAKKLMAKLHPDRVPIESCKAMLRMRFQLVQHARDLCAPELSGS